MAAHQASCVYGGMYWSFVAPKRNETNRAPRSSVFCSCSWPSFRVLNRVERGRVPVEVEQRQARHRHAGLRVRSDEDRAPVDRDRREQHAVEQAPAECRRDPSSGSANSGSGCSGSANSGSGCSGSASSGSAPSPTAEFGIGLFGIGENANAPSSDGGTELSGTFAAPAGTDGSSEVRPRPTSVSALVTERQAENSEVLPFASVAVAVID